MSSYQAQKKRRRRRRRTAAVIVLAGIVSAYLRFAGFGAVRIQTSAMMPHLAVGDVIVHVPFRDPPRGATVIYRDTGTLHAGAVVGFEHERVTFDDRSVTVSGADATIQFTLKDPAPGSIDGMLQTVVVGDGSWFVTAMHGGSTDSRSRGAFETDRFIGSAVWTVWPPRRWGLLKPVAPVLSARR